jgi:hypothetical protein
MNPMSLLTLPPGLLRGLPSDAEHLSPHGERKERRLAQWAVGLVGVAVVVACWWV